MTDPTGQNRIDRARTTYPDGEAAAPRAHGPMRTESASAFPVGTEAERPVPVRDEQVRATALDSGEARGGRRDRIPASQGLGGVRWGAVFFGWLCATGVAVLLVAIVAATGTAIGLTQSNVNAVANGAVDNANTVSLAGAIALLVVLAVAYLSGGFVAARMARFSGKSQGAGVWGLGLVITVLVALGGLLLGSAYDVLARLNLPRIPVDEGTATTGAIITLLAIMLVTLLAAVVGGALGDRYHRRLDEIDLR